MTPENYARFRMRLVPGYMTATDARLWIALLRWQSSCGIVGHLGEIGIFYGRSFTILGLLRRPGEKLFGCDLFPEGEGGRQHRGLRANLARHGIDADPPDILVGRSDALDPQDLAERYRPARFFHVDGHHGHASVLNDAALGAAVLHPQGLLVFDDVLDPTHPGVTRALFEFLDAHRGRLELVALTNKAYVTTPEAAPRYREALESLPAVRNLPRMRVSDRDGKVLHFPQSYAVAGLNGLADRVGRWLSGATVPLQHVRRGTGTSP